MSKIELSPLPSGFATVPALDARFQQIEDALNNNVLYRDNPDGEPNSMSNVLDMASNKIINLPYAATDFEAVPLVQVQEIITNTVGSGRAPYLYATFADLTESKAQAGSVLETVGFSVAGKGAAVYDVVEALGTPDGIGRVLLPTGLHAVLRPPYNIEQFGCLPDGTDISDGFQKALTYCEGAALEIPVGDYTRNKTIDGITAKNIVLWGHGVNSHIFFNDVSSIARKDFMVCSNCDFMYFRNFKISGTALTHPNETNASQCLTGENILRVVMEGVSLENLRYMATAFIDVDSALVTGCTLKNVIRDGIRFVASKNIVVTNNNLSNVSDDCIAIHSEDSEPLQDMTHQVIISNNTITACQSVKVLGAKNLIIDGNVFNFCLRGAIRVTPQNTDTTEGNTPQFNIVISNNVILDSFGNRGINSAIYVGSRQPRDFTGLPSKPIINSVPFPYNYTNNIDQAGVINIGAHTIQIVNNIVARTRPSGSTYSSFGYGQLFDRITVGLISDPVLSDTDFAIHGVIIEAPITDLLIQGNQISNTGIGLFGLSISINGTSNIVDVNNVSLLGNHFVDCPSGAFALYGISSGFGGSTINVFNNLFDGDPYFRHSDHNADNTWSNIDNAKALRFDSFYGIFASGNTFKNWGSTGLRPEDSSNVGNNIIHCDAITHGNNSGNKGIRLLPSAAENLLVPINGDPTSATYGHLLNTLITSFSSKPTTGKYVYGHFVENSDQNVTGTLGSQYIVTGWKRITTGTGHVLNTDWVEVRAPTGT